MWSFKVAITWLFTDKERFPMKSLWHSQTSKVHGQLETPLRSIFKFTRAGMVLPRQVTVNRLPKLQLLSSPKTNMRKVKSNNSKSLQQITQFRSIQPTTLSSQFRIWSQVLPIPMCNQLSIFCSQPLSSKMLTMPDQMWFLLHQSITRSQWLEIPLLLKMFL